MPTFEDTDLICCPFCHTSMSLGEARTIYKSDVLGARRYLGCLDCQEKETLPYDHEEYFIGISSELLRSTRNEKP